MRIAFTGAHGTGKTTLCNELQARLSERQPTMVSREVPRVMADAVGDKEFFRRGNNSLLRQMLIFFFQTTEDRFLAPAGGIILHDRTMLDHLAYTVTLFPHFKGTPECAALSAALKRWMQQYDLIFKVPIEFLPVDDGVREADVGFQKQIDREIDSLCVDFSVSPVVIRGSVAERADFVTQRLREIK